MVARNPSPGRKRGWVGLVERDGKPVPYEEKGFYHLGLLKNTSLRISCGNPPDIPAAKGYLALPLGELNNLRFLTETGEY